ncbi:MAG: helix-hairpin-helix domain-containing protein, partial [Gemmatimonadota bacterium]|nr:helix-hairpin-helix domain-containing protein [Gemmatimonadota bacterium]
MEVLEPGVGETRAARSEIENVEIATVLDEVADLLEIQEANPFRVRAYRNAVRTVETHGVAMRKLVEEGEDLTKLPAIGKEMARHIRELVETGELSVYVELSEEVPPSLVELMRLPGVGPKRARKLWDELGIETVDDLEEAARAGRVEELEGFGAKTQAKILEGIDSYRRHTSRFRLSEAERLVEVLLDHMRGADGLRRVEAAGSYRRRRETVGDVDLLAVTEDPSGASERLASYSSVSRVLGQGETKTSVQLRSGLQVDLRVVPEESWGAALVYFTGSKAHNIRLRQRALDRDLRVSEYGVFRAPETEADAGEADGTGSDPEGAAASAERRVSEGDLVAGATEEEVYAALDLAWIPPEIREDRGELAAAEAGGLPELVTLEDLRGDLQMHSTWSDGRNTIEEMLMACAERGYEYFALTDHSKALAMIEGLDEEKLRRQLVEIEEIQERHPEIRLFRSLEVDILEDGSLDLSDEMLERLDLVIVSVHSFFGLDPEHQTE